MLVISFFVINILQFQCTVHIRLCTSYIDDLTTVSYTAADSMVLQLFCTTALPDDGPVRPETCRSVVN